MVTLHPVHDEHGVVPYIYSDGGARESTYMVGMQVSGRDGMRVVYWHESGYGFLRDEDVKMSRRPVRLLLARKHGLRAVRWTRLWADSPTGY